MSTNLYATLDGNEEAPSTLQTSNSKSTAGQSTQNTTGKRGNGLKSNPSTQAPPTPQQKTGAKKAAPQVDAQGFTTPYPSTTDAPVSTTTARGPTAPRSPSTPAPTAKSSSHTAAAIVPRDPSPPPKGTKKYPVPDEDGFITPSLRKAPSPKNSPPALAAPKSPRKPRTPSKNPPRGAGPVSLNRSPIAHQPAPAPPSVKKEKSDPKSYSAATSRPNLLQQPALQQVQHTGNVVAASAPAAEDFPALPQPTPKKPSAATPRKLTFPGKQPTTPLPNKSPKVTQTPAKAPRKPRERTVDIAIWARGPTGAFVSIREDFPLNKLVARSRYFQTKYAGYPLTTTNGAQPYLKEELELDSVAVHCILLWFDSWSIRYEGTDARAKQAINIADGKCECIRSSGDRINYLHYAHLFRATHALELIGHCADQTVLRNALMYFCRVDEPDANIYNQQIAVVLRRCSVSNIFTDRLFGVIVEALERFDGNFLTPQNRFAGSRQASFKQAIAGDGGLFTAYNRAREDMLKRDQVQEDRAKRIKAQEAQKKRDAEKKAAEEAKRRAQRPGVGTVSAEDGKKLGKPGMGA